MPATRPAASKSLKRPPATSSSEPRNVFDFNQNRKPTNLERKWRCAIPFSIVLLNASLKRLSGLIPAFFAYYQAEINGEKLRPRTIPLIKTALSRLRRNEYIAYISIDQFKMTTPLKELLQRLKIALEDAGCDFRPPKDLTLLEHRAICHQFREKTKGKLSPAHTRQELRTSNGDTTTQGSTNEMSETDVIMDDIPAAHATTSRITALPQTPVRRSKSLNNPTAYPTPQSLPRRTTAETASSTRDVEMEVEIAENLAATFTPEENEEAEDANEGSVSTVATGNAGLQQECSRPDCLARKTVLEGLRGLCKTAGILLNNVLPTTAKA
ncbi:hypothetical protein BDZ97DRAFT_1809142 [Flammula alnicola]|nr:hypothetical protein BDZ97DRAFT_1809142 [Flammula alnicola]